MSFKVSEFSEMGGSLLTQPHSMMKTTQIEVTDSFEDIILPTSLPVGYLNQQNGTLTFYAPQSDSYTDLSKSYFRIRGTWNDVGGNGPQTADVCTPVCNFPSALFQDVKFYVNDQAMTPNKGGDLWISFVDRLLLNRRGAVGHSNSRNPAAVNIQEVDQDEEIGYDELDSAYAGATNVFADNYGAFKRSMAVIVDSTGQGGGAINTTTYEYLYRPSVGAWKIKKYIPDRVKFQIDLQVTPAGLYAFGGVAGQQWAFTITSIELILHRLKMHQSIGQQNSMMITQKQPWVAPIMQMMYSRNPINIGTSSINITSIYKGLRPKFLLVGVSDQATLAGNWLANPYYMSEGDIGTIAGAPQPKTRFFTSLEISVNGKQYPIRRPYDPVSIVSHQRDYRALLTNCADGVGTPAIDGTLINYKEYCTNYTWYCFNLSPLEGDFDEFDLTEEVNIELKGVFNNLTTAQQIIHTIAYVPAVVSLDEARVAKVSYR